MLILIVEIKTFWKVIDCRSNKFFSQGRLWGFVNLPLSYSNNLDKIWTYDI